MRKSPCKASSYTELDLVYSTNFYLKNKLLQPHCAQTPRNVKPPGRLLMMVRGVMTLIPLTTLRKNKINGFGAQTTVEHENLLAL